MSCSDRCQECLIICTNPYYCEGVATIKCLTSHSIHLLHNWSIELTEETTCEMDLPMPAHSHMYCCDTQPAAYKEL